jgi:hypothetical protein
MQDAYVNTTAGKGGRPGVGPDGAAGRPVSLRMPGPTLDRVDEIAGPSGRSAYITAAVEASLATAPALQGGPDVGALAAVLADWVAAPEGVQERRDRFRRCLRDLSGGVARYNRLLQNALGHVTLDSRLPMDVIGTAAEQGKQLAGPTPAPTRARLFFVMAQAVAASDVLGGGSPDDPGRPADPEGG